MGNLLTPNPHPASKKQLLLNEYSIFTVPSEFENCQSSQIPTPRIVYGKKYLKATLHLSHNFVDSTECQKQIDGYFLRHQSPELNLFPLVRVLGAKEIELKNTCNSYSYFCVVTEDLTFFDQIEDKFSFEQCLFLLFESLMGFYYLYVKNGSFPITEKMIGINNQGRLKVWINENFAFNRNQNSTFQVYINRNFTPQGQQTDRMNHRKQQQKMIKQIFTIINAKYQDRSMSFEQTLQKNIKRTLNDAPLSQMRFEELLRILCQYEQQSGSILFIPNKIRLQKGFESKLPQRQSFSLKIQKVMNEYRHERSSIQQRKSLDQTSEKVYSTGVDGNTLKKYVPNQNLSTHEASAKKPQVKFFYQDYGTQSGLMQSGYFLNENISHFNFSQYQRDYSVMDAESQVVGIRRSEFVERFEDFNQTRSRNEFTNQSYIPGEYEQQILSRMSKDMRETYFKSTQGQQAENPWMIKSSSQAEGIQMEQNMSRSNSELQLITSKFVEDLNLGRQRTTSSSLAPSSINWKNQHSSYKQKMIAPYLSEDSTNNFMRITEEIQQESYRPSLMSINIDGKKSFDQVSHGFKLSEKQKQSPSHFIEQNIVSPIIESRFTTNARTSPDYIEKPFSLAFSNTDRTSLEPQQKYNPQTFESFY